MELQHKRCSRSAAVQQQPVPAGFISCLHWYAKKKKK